MQQEICNLSKNNQFMAMVLIFSIALSGVFIINDCLTSEQCSMKNNLHDFSTTCLLSIDGSPGEFLTSGRAANYFWQNDMNPDDETSKKINYNYLNKNCILSSWALTHFFMYLILGFICPQFFSVFIASSVLFEIYEHYKWDCHDVLDVVWNTLGLIIGVKLRYAMCA